MRLGFLGSGNMASALARGIGEPVLCTDVVPARAEELARATGGEAVPDGAELARRADAVVLAHKPGQLAEAAAGLGGGAKAVVSILGGVGLDELRAAHPGVPVLRLMPNTPAAVGKGVIVVAQDPAATSAEDVELRTAVVALLERAGLVVELPEALMGAATALIGVAPAYVALFAEATVDAAVRHGVPPDVAGAMAAAGLEGGAALLRERDHDTLAVRRGVTSPGGSTARGLRELERGGLRPAVQDAFDAVVAVS